MLTVRTYGAFPPARLVASFVPGRPPSRPPPTGGQSTERTSPRTGAPWVRAKMIDAEGQPCKP